MNLIQRDISNSRFSTEELSRAPNLESLNGKNKREDYETRVTRRKQNIDVEKTVIIEVITRRIFVNKRLCFQK
jgi:hypothetical protein